MSKPESTLVKGYLMSPEMVGEIQWLLRAAEYPFKGDQALQTKVLEALEAENRCFVSLQVGSSK